MQGGVSTLFGKVNVPAAILLIGILPIKSRLTFSGDIYIHLHVDTPASSSHTNQRVDQN
jgi:hypothetical protein